MTTKKTVIFAGTATFAPSQTLEKDQDCLRSELVPRITDEIREIFQDVPHDEGDGRSVPSLTQQFDDEEGAFHLRIFWDEDRALRWVQKVADEGITDPSGVVAIPRTLPALERLAEALSPELRSELQLLLRVHDALRKARSSFLKHFTTCPNLSTSLIGGVPEAFEPGIVVLTFTAEVVPGTFKCPRCHAEIEKTRENMEGDGWIVCPRLDHETVYFFDDLTELDREEPDGMHRLSGSRRNYDLLRQLVLKAKSEGAGFVTPTLERFLDQRDRVYVAVKDRKIAGYSLWNDFRGKRCARQVFVLPKLRRQGIGSDLVRIEGDLKGDFYAEHPNETSMTLMVKLGYAERTDGGFRGIRVSFLPPGV